MRPDRFKTTVILLCSFVGICITFIIFQAFRNPIPSEEPTNIVSQNTLEATIDTEKTNGDTSNDNVEDISKLKNNITEELGELAELLDEKPADVMDREWNAREITTDFANRLKVEQAVEMFPVTGDVMPSKEQLGLLQDAVTEMIFDNGNNDYDSYLKFLKESGEVVREKIYYYSRDNVLAGKSPPAKEVLEDPWKVLSLSRKGDESRCKGLVLEGSEIKVFKANTINLMPPGHELRIIRGAVRVFHRMTEPPVSLKEAIKKRGNVLIADVKIFIAHDDKMGGIVRPYVIRYWFDTEYNLWRAEKARAYQNPKEFFFGTLVTR